MNKRRMKINSDEGLDVLETHLAGTLKRVTPRKDYVQGLRGRIHLPPREELMRRVRDWPSWFIAVGGVFSGMLVVITLARAMYHLFGRKHLG